MEMFNGLWVPSPNQLAPTNHLYRKNNFGWIVSSLICGSFKHNVCTEGIEKKKFPETRVSHETKAIIRYHD